VRAAETPARPSAGRIVGGRYRLEKLIAAGGMGRVYEAVHAITLKRCAIKLVRPDILGKHETKERFLREVQAPATIGHPGIVEVFDAGVDEDETMFLVMELVDGVSLRDHWKTPISKREAVEGLLELARILAAAHAKGFVHRDLKPMNVLVSGGRVRLLDFGIARHVDSELLTRTGSMLGTFRYMSPEQARNARAATAATDVWSIGIMLYEVLRGAPPFPGKDVELVRVAAAVPHVPLDKAGAAPAPLARVVDRCLAKRAAQRYADAGELAAALGACLADGAVARALEVPLPPEERDSNAATPDAPHATKSLEREAARSKSESGLSTVPTMQHTRGRTPDTRVVNRRGKRMPFATAALVVSALALAIAVGYATARPDPPPEHKTAFAREHPEAPAPAEAEAPPEVAREIERGPDVVESAPPPSRPSMRLISSTRPAMTEHDVRYGTNRAPIVD
jgi:serine/threonine-protein kinase